MRLESGLVMLHFTTTGSGLGLVLLHGWGLNASVWSELRTRLESRWRVTCIDLPGHGRSRAGIDLGDLDEVCAALHSVAPRAPAVWLGWSMGGLIAIAYALRYPQQVRRLILVASQPRFVRAPDWPHGMAGDLLDDFDASLERKPRKTLARFLALQVHGSENPARTLRRLHAALAAGTPDPASLKSGLALLRKADLRAQLALVTCRLRLFLGERVMLVPATAGLGIVKLIQSARYRVIARAGHAPFLSHVDEFTRTLENLS